MNEFRVTAQSGMPCKVYHYKRSMKVVSTGTMYMGGDLMTSAIKLSLDCSEQLRELPLVSTRVCDYEQLREQSSFLDSKVVEALLRDGPCDYIHQGIILLVTPEECFCIVLQDQEMMNKSKKALQCLSKFRRDMAGKA